MTSGSSLEDFLFGAEEPEPSKPVEEPASTGTSIVVENPLTDEEYRCPKCQKTYRAIFLMRPVNYDCTSCWWKTRER